ncbi:MAG TPA: 4a-hydroxytetrahydrobiopterin dehydratase [Bacteroidota bacterium]|nr:4a-hydroxytetrahydrobiopterin dehydratase [Bacteroidota bacterium]
MADLLSDSEIRSELQTIPGWRLEGKQIVKKFTAADFVRAMGFVNEVALLAQRANHHPDIDIRWNVVTLVLSTHSAGGLTAKDFELARLAEALPL